MYFRLFCAALALTALLAGCSKPPAQVYQPPAPSTPSTPTAPAPSAPVALFPNSIGAYREGMGPGLVLQGHTSLPQALVELLAQGKVVQSGLVGAKDGGPGYWSVAWPVPEGTDLEVVLKSAVDGTVLVRGPVSPEMFVGLFHSPHFSHTRVDAKAASRDKLRVSGMATSGESVKVEFRDPLQKVLGTQQVKVNQGGFNAELPWPEGASHLYFYTAAGELGLMIQIVAR